MRRAKKSRKTQIVCPSDRTTSNKQLQKVKLETIKRLENEFQKSAEAIRIEQQTFAADSEKLKATIAAHQATIKANDNLFETIKELKNKNAFLVTISAYKKL